MPTLAYRPPIPAEQLQAALDEILGLLASQGVPVRVLGNGISEAIVETGNTLQNILGNLPVSEVILVPGYGIAMLVLPDQTCLLVRGRNIVRTTVNTAMNYLLNKLIEDALYYSPEQVSTKL